MQLIIHLKNNLGVSVVDDYRRKADDVLNELNTNVQLILQEQRNHTEWQRKHEEKDEENFKESFDKLNESKLEIEKTKTRINTASWFLSGAFSIVTIFLEFFRWSYRK